MELAVPIENVGTGPAFHIHATVTFRNPDGSPPEPDTEERETSGTATLVSLRADGRVPLVIPFAVGEGGGSEYGFELTLTYEDIAEQRWRTEDLYVPFEKAYRGAMILRS
jgi:hypothetical protein